MAGNKGKFNVTVAAFWETKTGNLKSMPVDARSHDQIMKGLEAVEQGGMLIMKRLSDEARAKFPNPETAPHYFLEVISRDDVSKFNSRSQKQAAVF